MDFKFDLADYETIIVLKTDTILSSTLFSVLLKTRFTLEEMVPDS